MFHGFVIFHGIKSEIIPVFESEILGVWDPPCKYRVQDTCEYIQCNGDCFPLDHQSVNGKMPWVPQYQLLPLYHRSAPETKSSPFDSNYMKEISIMAKNRAEQNPS